MSDRYHQPAPGTLLDTWGQVLNQNFFDIGNDVDQLFESMLSAEDLNPLHGTLYPQSAADIKIAIENAVDGAKIVIPSGTYAVDNLLNVRTNITLAGHGMRSTILNKTNDAPVLDLRNCNRHFVISR